MFHDIDLTPSARAHRAVCLLREISRIVCSFGAPLSMWVIIQTFARDWPGDWKFAIWLAGSSLLYLATYPGVVLSCLSMRPLPALAFLAIAGGPAAYAVIPYTWNTGETLSHAIVFGTMLALILPFLWALVRTARLSLAEKQFARPCAPVRSLPGIVREIFSIWPGLKRSLWRAMAANALSYAASLTLWLGGALFAVSAFLVISLMLAFLRSHGAGEVAMQFVALLILLFLTGLVQSMLRKCARWFSRASYAEQVERDRRPPILFLRSFQDDQVRLAEKSRLRAFVRTVFSPGLRSRRLDHILIESFSRFGPALALGTPGEKNLPFGAARVYCTHDSWKSKVAEIADRARYVILVADSTPGVEWELSHFLKAPWREKTLFVVAPKSSDLRDAPTLAKALANEGVPPDGRPILACHWDAAGQLQVMRADVPRSPEVFIVAMQRFFRQRP